MGVDFAVLMQFILKLFQAFKSLVEKLGILDDEDTTSSGTAEESSSVETVA